MLLRPLGCDGLFRVNWPFSEEFGLLAEDLRRKPLLDWIHASDRARVEDAIGACERGEVPSEPLIARHQLKDGRWAALQWQLALHDGQCVAHGQVVADQAVSSKQPAVADNATNLGETLDAMARIVEAKNPGMLCSILLVDERGEQIVGGAGPSLPAAYNKSVEGLRIGPTVGSCGTATFWNTPIVVEDIHSDPLWRDLGNAAKLAGVAACWSHPIVDSHGHVLGAMALYYTEPRAPERYQMDGLGIAAKMVGLAVERDRLEQHLRRTEKMEALGLLAGGVAHDFNNLLTVILGNAELIRAQLPAGSELAEMSQEVLLAGQSAAELCGQILAYTGRGRASGERIQCNTLLREVGSLARVAMGQNTRLDYDLTEADCCVVGDAGQLQSLLLNLITNACDAIGNRPGRIVVSTRVRYCSLRELKRLGMRAQPQAGAFVEIEVIDTGSGIAAADLARIFDPFFSTKSAKRGLGLAAAQGIAASHRGAIMVSSEPGVGTTFTVLLPLASTAVNGSVDVAEPSEVPAGLRVLLADDDVAVRSVVMRMLRDAGMEVLAAGDGQQAVDMFVEHQASIGCVLLDCRMPRLTGSEALVAIRRFAPQMPVLLMSGYAEQSSPVGMAGALDPDAAFPHDPLADLVATGATAVLQKPTPRRDLIAAVCAAVRS
jgi:signal transduction histidine kinase/CheY-like chemotaxis protein